MSFEVEAGQTYGIIGSNGSGKSTLLKCLAKIYWPTSGSITYNGKMASLLEVGSGFHLELSGRENIYLNGSILGMSRKEIDSKIDSIIEFSGVERFIDQPVKNYSSGMYVRLGFSVAIHVQPDILVVDEVLSVGDEEFQKKSFDKFLDLKREGKTIILVSHALDVVADICDRVSWIEKGVLQTSGPGPEVGRCLPSQRRRTDPRERVQRRRAHWRGVGRAHLCGWRRPQQSTPQAAKASDPMTHTVIGVMG